MKACHCSATPRCPDFIEIQYGRGAKVHLAIEEEGACGCVPSQH